MKIFIKLIPKDIIIYKLWLNAKPAGYIKYCKSLAPELTEEIVRSDLLNQIESDEKLKFTQYYGRNLFIDVSGDFLDTTIYNRYNGDNAAEKTIAKIKFNLMKKTILSYYKA